MFLEISNGVKFFGSAIAILFVGLVIVWGVFFSGEKIKKSESEATSMNSQVQSNTVVLETNFGPIKIKLDESAAPKTAENFKKLAREKFYDGLTFHRVIPDFVIQGGDPNGNGTGGPGYTVEAEINLPHRRGAVAAARLPDQLNPQRESSGSQFYIALQDLPMLDGQYTVFGEVASGMEVVDLIARVRTDENDKPVEPVIIKKAYIE